MYYPVPWYIWRCYNCAPIPRKRNTCVLFVWLLSWGSSGKLLPTLSILADSPVGLSVALRYIDSSRSLVPVHSSSLRLGSVESDCLTLTFICIYIFLFPGVYLFLETVSYFVIQSALEFTKILLSQPPKHWDYRHETPCPASPPTYIYTCIYNICNIFVLYILDLFILFYV